MKTRIRDWMDKPFSNGTYLTLFVGCIAIYAIIMAVYGAFLFWDNICDRFNNLVNKVKEFFTVRVTIHREEAE